MRTVRLVFFYCSFKLKSYEANGAGNSWDCWGGRFVGYFTDWGVIGRVECGCWLLLDRIWLHSVIDYGEMDNWCVYSPDVAGQPWFTAHLLMRFLRWIDVIAE